jgi:hypothetical protein
MSLVGPSRFVLGLSRSFQKFEKYVENYVNKTENFENLVNWKINRTAMTDTIVG